jgi:hypothetical protein
MGNSVPNCLIAYLVFGFLLVNAWLIKIPESDQDCSKWTRGSKKHSFGILFSIIQPSYGTCNGVPNSLFCNICSLCSDTALRTLANGLKWSLWHLESIPGSGQSRLRVSGCLQAFSARHHSASDSEPFERAHSVFRLSAFYFWLFLVILGLKSFLKNQSVQV